MYCINDQHAIMSLSPPHTAHPGGVPHPQQCVPSVPSVQFWERADGTGPGGPACPDPEHVRSGCL